MVKEMLNLVMLVDDNDVDNFISKRVIELNGFAKSVETQSSGSSALAYLEQYQDEPDMLPELIFLDINMPIVDGFVFLYELENFPETVQKKCKVVILSSSDNKKDIDKIISNTHVIKFITKPLTDRALKEVQALCFH